MDKRRSIRIWPRILLEATRTTRGVDRADAYVERNGLDFPLDPEARRVYPEPACIAHPILQLDLAKAGISSIIWATGYVADYSWVQVDAFDVNGNHGISAALRVSLVSTSWGCRTSRAGGRALFGAFGTTQNTWPIKSLFNGNIWLTVMRRSARRVRESDLSFQGKRCNRSFWLGSRLLANREVLLDVHGLAPCGRHTHA